MLESEEKRSLGNDLSIWRKRHQYVIFGYVTLLFYFHLWSHKNAFEIAKGCCCCLISLTGFRAAFNGHVIKKEKFFICLGIENAPQTNLQGCSNYNKRNNRL